MADSIKRKTLAIASLKKCAEGKSVSKKNSESFNRHIQKIETARKQAELIVGSQDNAQETDEASVSALWELVFDYLCSAPELTVGDFNTIAGVIQKLASARAQIINSRGKKSVSARGPASGGLAAESIEEIERRLNLL